MTITWKWTGPQAHELQPNGYELRQRVPPERWPYGPPEDHDRGCRLHSGGLFCDCGASCADDDGIVR